jgi:hypothetical protein
VFATLGVFGHPDALVFVVVEPVDFASILRKIGIHVSPEHQTTVVVVFLNISIQVEICNSFVDRVYAVLP